MQPKGNVVRRFVFDFSAGLALISTILFAMVETSTAGIATGTALGAAPWLPYILIASMFSLVMAFNLALYRHVRRVYVGEPARGRRSAGKSGA